MSSGDRRSLRERVAGLARVSRPSTTASSVLASMAGSLAGGDPLRHTDIYILALLYTGVFLSHLVVNILNDYLDYRRGLDLYTPETPFSGGSKAIVEGLVTPGEALTLGMSLLVASVSIGVYLAVARGPLVLVFMSLGALIILLYTTVLTRYMLGELGVYIKGVLVSLGSYYVVYQGLGIYPLLIGSFYGLASVSVLYMNSIPDREVDKVFGKRTISSVVRSERLWLVYLLLATVSIANYVSVALVYRAWPLALLAAPLYIVYIVLALYLKSLYEREALFIERLGGLTRCMASNILLYRVLEVSLVAALLVSALSSR